MRSPHSSVFGLSLAIAGAAILGACDSSTSGSPQPTGPIAESEKATVAAELARLARHTDLILSAGFNHESQDPEAPDDSAPCVNPAYHAETLENGMAFTDTITYVDGRGKLLAACPDRYATSRRMLVAMRGVGPDTVVAHYDMSSTMTGSLPRITQQDAATGSMSVHIRDGFAAEFASMRSSGSMTAEVTQDTVLFTGSTTTRYQLRFGKGAYTADMTVTEEFMGPWSMADAEILYQGRKAGSIRYSAADDVIRVYDIDGQEVKASSDGVIGTWGAAPRTWLRGVIPAPFASAATWRRI